MADTGIKFRKAAFERTRDAVRLVESAPWGNGRAPYEATPLGDNLINISGEEIPPFSICCVTAYGTKGEAHYLKVTKPGTTFRQTLRINGVNAIATPGVGFCAFAPAYIVRYDTGTPAYGEGWGPKPGQWTISKGFPGCRILGIFDSDMKLAYVELLSPITTLLGHAITDLAASTSYSTTSDYKIYTGTTGSESDSGFTTLPSIYMRVAVAKGKKFTIEWINNGWQVNSAEPYVAIGKTDSSVSAGSSGTVSIWTGTPGSESDSGDNITGVRNRTGVDIPTTKWVRVEYINGNPYMEPWEC